jgi:hypothetical protein
MIAIYDHNDSGQYSKTMVLANLALAMSVNYDHKVHFKLNRTFPPDHKTFKVQATVHHFEMAYP